MSKARELSQRAGVDGALSNRNLIINGAMQVAQRGTSASGITSSTYTTVDRFKTNGNNGTWTVSQDTDAPDGFSNSFKMLLTATEALISNSYMAVEQKIEGQNLQQLAYGTSAAKTVTVSFWVKSNITGTYCLNLYQDDGTKNYPQTYTIDSAGTWEYKTISYVGDTATSLDNDNTSSLRTMFFLVAGSDFNSGSAGSRVSYTNATFAAGQSAQVGATINDYFQITGVQLEVGDTATPFEHRSYGQELALCQRYFNNIVEYGGSSVTGFVSAAAYSSGINYGPYTFPVEMRTSPTLSYSSLSHFRSRFSNNQTPTDISYHGTASKKQTTLQFSATSTAGQAGWFEAINSNAYLYLDAEL